MRFSICIPTYEMRGNGVRFLDELFESLANQTFKEFEVIVSDHSRDGRIKELCEQWQKRNTFSIRYISYPGNEGNPEANRKNAGRAASGKIIKPLDQDDFMYDKNCLQKIVTAIRQNPKASWGMTGWIITNEHATEFSEPIASPAAGMEKSSVIFYKNGEKKFSTQPLIVTGPLVAIRRWPFQASRYVLRNQLNSRDRRAMAWLSTKRLVRKYMLNPLQKKS